MKLSKLRRATELANERWQVIQAQDSIEAGENVEVTVGGWPIDLSGNDAETVCSMLSIAAAQRLEAIEAEMAGLGIEIDVSRDVLRRFLDDPDEADAAFEDEAGQPATQEAAAS